MRLLWLALASAVAAQVSVSSQNGPAGGDTVRIEMLDDRHHSIFGAIEQTVTPLA